MQRFFVRLSQAMAVLGGAVLSLMVALIVLSILGREANAFLHGAFAQSAFKGLADGLLALRLPGLWGPIRIGSVNGDYELVEAGAAFAIFSFLPLAQITGAHATVDVFTAFLPERVNRALRALTETVFAIVLVIIAVQLAHGTLDKMHRHTTTFLLQFPLWWAYGASLSGALVAALVGLYTSAARWGELVTGRRILTAGGEAET